MNSSSLFEIRLKSFPPVGGLCSPLNRYRVLFLVVAALLGTPGTQAGTLVSWGNNSWQQVGNTPLGTGFKAVAAGGGFSVAVASDGSLVAWGADDYGQVSGTPPGIGFSTVAAGAVHAVAIREDRTLAAWGFGPWVSGVPAGTYTAVAAGGSHSVALRSDGSVAAWGENTYGRIADTPTTGTFTAVAAGGAHSLALRDDGRIIAWGWTDYGQVSETPADGPYIAIAAGYAHSLAIRADGTLVGWGWDEAGQVSGIQALPSLPAGVTYIGIGAGFFHSIALRSDGVVVAWGQDSYGVVSGVPTSGSHSAVASGHYHGIALLNENVPNLPPNAVAIANPSPVVVGQTVTLDGTASNDPEGGALAFSWSITAAPAESLALVTDSAAAVAHFTPDLIGDYEFTLLVTDPQGATAATVVRVSAISSTTFAQALITQAADLVVGLGSSQLTTRGNGIALGNFLRQASDALQASDPAGGAHKLTQVLERTDGVAVRGQVDARGSGSDWVTDPAAQLELYDLVVAALSAFPL